ncbi:MAG: hypothetical protein J2O46_01160 [Nocardioides sp.]|nr:hypothetical protein [Nocardioides sp.]
MSRRTVMRLAAAGTAAGLAATGTLIAAGAASAESGDSAIAQESRGKGVPTAGFDFFLNHLNTYHFGRPYAGFDAAAEDLYGWSVYHFTPTFLETGARAVSPKDAPDVQGDTWQTTSAPAPTSHDEHGMSHVGDDLRSPIAPTAGLQYGNLWLQQSLEAGDPSALRQAVPAGQETVRRTLTPTEPAPPVENDSWSDKRPTDNSGAVVLVPGKVVEPVARGSEDAGTVAERVLDEAAGESAGHHTAAPAPAAAPKTARKTAPASGAVKGTVDKVGSTVAGLTAK